MVGLFVRLKLRLLRASLRKPARLVLVILGLVLGTLTVGLLGVSLFVFRDEPRTAAALVKSTSTSAGAAASASAASA